MLTGFKTYLNYCSSNTRLLILLTQLCIIINYNKFNKNSLWKMSGLLAGAHLNVTSLWTVGFGICFACHFKFKGLMSIMVIRYLSEVQLTGFKNYKVCFIIRCYKHIFICKYLILHRLCVIRLIHPFLNCTMAD